MNERDNTLLLNSLFKLLANFLKLKHESKDLSKYFEDNYIKTVAVYGIGYFGKEIYKELLELKNIKVLYAIDKNAQSIENSELKIFKLTDELPPVDAIVVTPIQYYNEIEKDLYKKGINNTISIEDIVRYCV